jgi:hypothetical protein
VSTEIAKGASKSLNKTISEIMEHLGDERRRPKAKLRKFMRARIGDLCEHWYKRGFRRGHMQSVKTLSEPLRYECSRKLSPGQNRKITLISTIKASSKKGRK